MEVVWCGNISPSVINMDWSTSVSCIIYYILEKIKLKQSNTWNISEMLITLTRLGLQTFSTHLQPTVLKRKSF